jgi:amino acid transporter
VTDAPANDRELRRDLGTFDIVLAQIIFVVGGTWVGTAGKLGATHVVLWLVAAALFFVPHVLVVVFLNRWHPLEGGLYQWAKLGFGELVGFLVAFNLGVYAIVITSGTGLELAVLAAYAIGSRAAWLASSHAAIAAATIAITVVLAAFSTIGLRVGKWVHNYGGASRIAVYAMLVALPLARLLSGEPLHSYSLGLVAPTMSLFTLNILGKMGFGAFSGFEYVAIFAGESRDPARSFGRAVAIAGPIVVALFVLGTASVVAFVPPGEIDLIAPLPQALERGALAHGVTRAFAPIAAVAIALAMISYGSTAFSGIVRLPMVAGWDGLLPAWFTRLHPRWRTPTNSILFVGAVSAAFGVAATFGAGAQEAYQVIASAALVLYALTYLVKFALPIFAATKMDPRPPWWIRAAAVSGLAMTALFIGLALVPIVAVENRAVFALKIGGVVALANVGGVALYFAATRRGLSGARDA